VTAPSALLEAVAEVVQLAGRVALRHWRTGLTVYTKDDGSPVTVADREAETAAREWIAARFPGDAVLGEEFGASAGTAAGGRRWLIDPIDGTKTFVRGVPLWGSMVGVVEDGRVVAGAICCPALEETVAAAEGCGCWWNGARCQVSGHDTLAGATILTTDDRFPYNPGRAARWAGVAAQVEVARTWGDCYGYLLVATGRAHLMVDDRLSAWDAAPLIPVITEAGGVFTDWRGRTSVDGTDGVASNAALAGAFRQLLGVPEPGT
jgi:histidinol-phosphatase